MYRFKPAGAVWWQKPLVLFENQSVPAEIAILRSELKRGEAGIWKNSSSLSTGVIDLRTSAASSFETVRIQIPASITTVLRDLYKVAGLSKGCPDLVVWRKSDARVRFIEIKRKGHDSITKEQEQFISAAQSAGVSVRTIYWDFL